MTKEAIKQALEVFGGCNWHDEIVDSDWADKAQSAIKALEEALKQDQGEQLARLGWQEIDCPICGGGARAFPKQKQGEPVAEVVEDNFSRQIVGIGAWRSLPNWTKLYTTPQTKEWVGLTDEDIEDCYIEELYLFAVALEAKLKQKNNIGENNLS